MRFEENRYIKITMECSEAERLLKDLNELTGKEEFNTFIEDFRYGLQLKLESENTISKQSSQSLEVKKSG